MNDAGKLPIAYCLHLSVSEGTIDSAAVANRTSHEITNDMSIEQNRIMVITGASRGIGRATALLAASHGYTLCVNYLENRQAAESLATETRNLGAPTITVQADISNADDITRLFREVDEQLGPVSALINNAGVLDQAMRVDAMTPERIARIMATNVTGAMLCAKEAVLRMSTRYGGTGGSIVNISSRAAVLGSANEFVDYAASKGAVDTFTVGLANEVAAEGIRVNAVRPGLIETDIHASSGDSVRVERLQGQVPMQRGGTAEEVAQAILWLASENAAYTTGSFIEVSGGR